MAVGNVFGYDTYMICDDTLRNIGENGQITGFALDLRIANYRGYLLSQIEDIRIRLGEEWMDRGALRFAIHGRTYTLDEMATETDNRWGILDRATLTCLLPGGLRKGCHDITVEEYIRASYIPMTARAFSSKVMTLQSDA
jgi:hypothetical protein